MIRRRAINVHPTNTCNYHCPFCFENMDKDNPTYLDITKLIEFIDRYAPVHVGFVGGEPTLWMHLPEALDELKSRSITTCVVTNGSTLDTMMTLPDTLSIGVSNDMEYNKKVVNFIQDHPDYLDNIEITITMTDLDKIDALINAFSVLGITRFNLSLLAFWNRNPIVYDLIDDTYIDELLSIIQNKRDGITIAIFGAHSAAEIRSFYKEEYRSDSTYTCIAPLNIYSDGHLEFCDLEYYPIPGQNINSVYDVYEIDNAPRGPYGVESPCKYCNLRR